MLSVKKSIEEDHNDSELNSIQEAIDDIRNGKLVIVVDDESRENEGDFICAAECATPEIINFMATHGRGLICTPITVAKAKALKLHNMVTESSDLHKTAFTVSIDYTKKGCTTGISAYDRSTGIKAMVEETTLPEDFARPGHIFPLVAKDGGVLRRSGHTEAAVDLASLAGFKPAGVLVEILNEDGTMARLPQLLKIAKKLDLKIISIDDLIKFRLQKERLVTAVNTIPIQTPYGEFELMEYKENRGIRTHLVLKKGNWKEDEVVLTRVHASTNSAELFSTFLSDAGDQIRKSLEIISRKGQGAIILLRYEEIENPIQSIMERLKEQVDNQSKLNPFIKRSSKPIHKDIGIGAQILMDIGIHKVNLITNAPFRKMGLQGFDLDIVEHTPFLT